MVLACLLIGVIGARAQNLKQVNMSKSDFLIYLDTMPSHIQIGRQIPNYMQLPYKLNPTYELDEIEAITQPIDNQFTPIKPVEYYRVTPCIDERNKSAIIEYLMNLIAELMEPGETITIKKAKE